MIKDLFNRLFHKFSKHDLEELLKSKKDVSVRLGCRPFVNVGGGYVEICCRRVTEGIMNKILSGLGVDLRYGEFKTYIENNTRILVSREFLFTKHLEE